MTARIQDFITGHIEQCPYDGEKSSQAPVPIALPLPPPSMDHGRAKYAGHLDRVNRSSQLNGAGVTAAAISGHEVAIGGRSDHSSYGLWQLSSNLCRISMPIDFPLLAISLVT